MRMHWMRLGLRLRRAQIVKVLALSICSLTIVCFILPSRQHSDLNPAFPNFRNIPKHVMKVTDWVQRIYTVRKSTNQTCVHPDLDPFEPSIMQFYQPKPLVDCTSAMEDWVYTTNGTFRISQRARRLHGKITCEYAPLVRVDDFSARHAPHIKPMVDGAPLQTDFFKVACVSGSGRRYMNIHSGVAWNMEVLSRLEQFHTKKTAPMPSATSLQSSSSPPPSSLHSAPISPGDSVSHDVSLTSVRSASLPGLNLSVFIFGFDSMSRMSWIRLLPRSRQYFLETLGGLELEGYNIVGDGTPAALLPILTGHQEEELPETRRGVPGAQPVDGHPWVWKEFKRHGYVTAYAEDMASIGTFELRMLGFKEQPTDHNMRLFYLAAERMYKNNVPYCLGSTPRHLNFMHWFEELFNRYKRFPKFFFGFHSELSHDCNNPVQSLDKDLTLFLRRLEENGHLNSTLLILMADHGARFSHIRATTQGKLEERMPYFAFRFPPWVKQVHPHLIRNLEINSQRLTTPFDIHETLMEVLTYNGSGVGDISKRAISLFKEIPEHRSCSHAGVTPHWCACLKWDTLNMSDSTVLSAVKSAISEINSYTKSNRKICALLQLSQVTRAARYTPSLGDFMAEQSVLNYRETFRQRPSPLELVTLGYSDPMHEIYQVSFITQPGNGHFEVTCTLDMTSGKFSVASTDISRINTYGKDPDCIVDSSPHLRPYCYCI